MTNNLKEIKKYLNWETEDDFYYVEITERKKDNEGLNRNSNVINSYQITSMKELDRMMPEFILLSKLYNARVGINLNRKSFRKTAYNVLDKLAKQLCSLEYKNVQNTYQSASSGKNNNGINYWILDMDDTTEIDTGVMMDIDSLEPNEYVRKAMGVIHTKSGYHIITKPFRIDQFRKIYPKIEIKKNNMTMLYIP